MARRVQLLLNPLLRPSAPAPLFTRPPSGTRPPPSGPAPLHTEPIVLETHRMIQKLQSKGLSLQHSKILVECFCDLLKKYTSNYQNKIQAIQFSELREIEKIDRRVTQTEEKFQILMSKIAKTEVKTIKCVVGTLITVEGLVLSASLLDRLAVAATAAAFCGAALYLCCFS